MDARASVVVPILDRPGSLARCLAALSEQAVPLDVIVVHDGDRCAAQVDDLCRAHGARVVRIAPSGPAAARNAGIARARCPFVLFLDDDCEPVPAWAERMVAELDAGADVVAGGVANASPGDPLAAATQLIHDHLTESGSEPFATTNNVGCRRDVLDAVRFDPDYPLSGEDRDWCHRLVRAGFAIARAPEAAVLHRHDLTLRSFVRKHVNYGRGSQRFRARNEPTPNGARWYWALLRRGFRHGVAAGLLVGVAQAAGAYGAARERL